MNKLYIFLLKLFGVIPEEMSSEEYEKRVDEKYKSS